MTDRKVQEAVKEALSKANLAHDRQHREYLLPRARFKWELGGQTSYDSPKQEPPGSSRCHRAAKCGWADYTGWRAMEESTRANHLPKAAGLQYVFLFTFRSRIMSTWDAVQSSPAVAAVLCRAQAKKLWADKAAFDKLGIRLVCVVHQMPVAEYEVRGPAASPCLLSAAQATKYCLAHQH